MPSIVDEIKKRLDIIGFMSDYIVLKQAGRNYTALCPFHSEKIPSFVIFPESQNWRCFGPCGDGGDIVDFLMKHDGINLQSAIQILAVKAGIESQYTEQKERLSSILAQ